MPGISCGDRGNWDQESLCDQSHACFFRGKIKFRAFPKRVGPRILLLESVDYEQVNTTEWLKKNKNLN